MLAFFFFLQYSKQYHAIELVLILDGWWDSFGLKKTIPQTVVESHIVLQESILMRERGGGNNMAKQITAS